MPWRFHSSYRGGCGPLWRLVFPSGSGSDAPPARWVGTSIPDPAGGLRVVGLSFIGLSGLVSGMPPSNPTLCIFSNCWMLLLLRASRPLPGISRTHHHHPSPGHSQTSISTLLTCPSATRASFPPSPCALCAGLCGASSDRCGRQGGCQGGGSSGCNGRSVCTGGGGFLAARMGGGGRARACLGVSGGLLKQQPRSSSTAAAAVKRI